MLILLLSKELRDYDNRWGMVAFTSLNRFINFTFKWRQPTRNLVMRRVSSYSTNEKKLDSTILAQLQTMYAVVKYKQISFEMKTIIKNVKT